VNTGATLGLSEADTRAKLIDPAIHARGWTEDLIRREETAGAIEIIDGRPFKQAKGRIDYTLRVKAAADSQPVAVALIEAKPESKPPGHGLEQAKLYAASKRLNVQFVYASNGHQFVEYDRITGLTHASRKLTEFPTPTELQARYEQGIGFALDDPAAAPLLQRYPTGEGTRRYYQDAAIRAVLEKIARCECAGTPKRALLSLATGAGKTFIAVNLLRRIADAGQLKRALFVCDRDELRLQGTGALQAVFGADAAPVSSGNPQKNARILIATYQTLDVATDDADANFLLANYPEDCFSHIVIDECHRSAWGKWSQVLTRNPGAVQIGLTATPRTLVVSEKTKEALADQQVNADNLAYFGEPVYEYDMSQGIEDGYLAACEIVKLAVFLDGERDCEEVTGVDKDDLAGKRLIDAFTGAPVDLDEAREHYDAQSFEALLLIPERVREMCADLFAHLVATGGPEQKTIVFCARDQHADRVAAEMNNLYAAWCGTNECKRADPYAFKCTASVGGADYIADLKAASRSHFIATTVDLLSTGVDVPPVRNIVFFKYVRSPISFYQMVGRGTRLDATTGKLMFRVYDYTNATRLFGEDFAQKYRPPRQKPRVPGQDEPPEPPTEPEIIISAGGFEVRLVHDGTCIVTMDADGKAMPIPVEEYKERLATRLITEAPTLEAFRQRWIAPLQRQEMLAHLPDAGRSAVIVQLVDDMAAYDLYDVLAELGYGLAPRTRLERAEAFTYKHARWLSGLPTKTAATLHALAMQFARDGTKGLESPQVFRVPDVVRAGGLAALQALGEPSEVLLDTKARMFAA
jgi:type I restriction enzyme R subunit